MIRGRAIPWALALCLLQVQAAEAPVNDVVAQAMSEELERSTRQLKIEGLPEPYFISYRVDGGETISATGRFGSLLSSNHWRYRQAAVEVRVGSYEFDNSNYVSTFPFRTGMLRYRGGRATLTLEDDPLEIRRTLWLATDDAYKEAVEKLSLKKAALQSKTRSDEIPDFAREEPSQIVEAAPPTTFEQSRVEDTVRRLSAVFRDTPGVFDANVNLSVATTRTRYLNSEGSRFDRTTPLVSLIVWAQTQAVDGLPLEDAFTWYGREFADLPATDKLRTEIRGLGDRLAGLRELALAERYNGPVLLEGQAAAELFAQGFAPRLLASRIPVADDARTASRYAPDKESFAERIGARVLPRFLAVVDDPSIDVVEEMRLPVRYAVDDQGVPARKTILIERGILKTLLMDRTPIRGLTQSNGHSRGGGIMPSNLVVQASDGLSDKELRDELLLEIADRELEYGIVVRRIRNHNHGSPSIRLTVGSSGRRDSPVALVEASKVFPDGHEEPIRNAEISGLTARSFKDIIAASAERYVHTVPLRKRTSAGYVNGVFTVVVPSLLFEDMTITRPSGDVPKLPVYPNPYFERKAASADPP